MNDYDKELFMEMQIEINSQKKENEELKEYFAKAMDHLEYCGWGDSWERECSVELEKEIDILREKYNF